MDSGKAQNGCLTYYIATISNCCNYLNNSPPLHVTYYLHWTRNLYFNMKPFYHIRNLSNESGFSIFLCTYFC